MTDIEYKKNAYKEKMDRAKALCQFVFIHNKEGKELLAILKEAFILNTPVVDLKQGEHWPYFREGQNNMLRLLEEWANSEINDAR